MAKKLDHKIGDILKTHGFGPEAAWDCHGTWVVYHNVLEQIAAKSGIEFLAPLPLETNGAAKSVAICVTGSLKDRSEWSIGEASPANCKNAYPYAMAEKRGKDRVILKLIGLHGLAYSEEEADSFVPPAQGDKPTQRDAIHGASTMKVEPLPGDAGTTKPPPAKTAMTPQAWAQMGIDRIATFNSKEEIDAFEDKYGDKIAKLAESLPDMHKKLVAAIADRHFQLDMS